MARFNRSFSDGGQKISGTDADISGDAVITGDLTVNGTTTTISSTTLTVADKVIVVAQGAADSSAADGAGLSVDGADATFLYDHTGTQWETNKPLEVTGNIATTGEILTAKVSYTDGDDAITIADGGGITANTSLTLASGATVTSIKDEDAMGSNSATALATQQSIKAYVDSQTSGAGNMDNWILEDDDGTEVTVSNGKEVKFIGSGLTTNFTDTSDGTDGDPYDLTFTVDAAQTGITSVVNASLEIGRDADNRIKFGTDNQIIFEVDGGDNVIFKTSGEIEASSLDISGDVDVDGTLEADAITVNGSALAASATTDTTNASNIGSGTVNAARMAAAQTAIESVLNTSLVVGRDADNQLKFGTDNEITFRVSGNDGVVMKASGEIEATSLDISGDVDVDGTLEADAITVNGSALAASATTDATNASNIGSGTLAAARMASAQTGIESVLNTSLVAGRDADNQIKFGTDNEIIFRVSGGDGVTMKASGEIEATSLDISGDADIDGTLEADAITVGGTALNTVIAGVTVTNATTAAVATTVTISDNESTNEENAVIFTAGGDVDGGNIGLESDGDLTYNPSTGTLSATIFKGNVDAVDGDFDGTLEADAITVGGTNLLTGGVVTSLGTITQDTVTFTSANADDPLLIIKNTTNDTAAARLRFVKDKGAAGADADGCGEIEFYGDDDNQDNILFARLRAEVADASNGAEGGRIMLGVATHDGEFQNGLVIEDGDAEDEIDVIVGNGDNSVTTAAGYMKASNGFLIPEQKSIHIETPMLATADHTATGITTIMSASENIAQGDLVYVSGNGTIGIADADAVAKMPAFGLAVAAISSGQPGVILLRGMFRDDTYNFTAGNRLFVHTDGTVTATAPSGNNDVAQAVGIALSDDVIYFSPDMTLVEITA